MSAFKQDRSLILLLLGWAVLAIAALFLRPLWPVDETRYVAVAWEMWQRGDFLVPHLNGEAYSHKPPLLFWLMHAGWAVFGVNEWWPRLLAPLLALAGAWLMLLLARRLWPESAEVGGNAIWIYSGTLLFGAMFTLVGFDGLLVCSTLIGMLGIVRAARGELLRGMLWLGVGIGLGVLSKGPVILLHLLPAAVLAPWWSREVCDAKGRWYLALLGAIAFGAVIALAWAIPAAYFGGETYRNAIFWGQTAGRMASSFAHRAPFWWYLPMLPLLLFPWLLWPSLWRGFKVMQRDDAVRFLLAWMLPVLIGFSLISGKQERYLLPLVPAFALLAAHALQQVQDKARRFNLALPALGFAVLAGAWGYAMTHVERLGAALAGAQLPLWPGLVFAALALVLFVAGRAALPTRLRLLSGAMWTLFLAAYLSAIPLLAPYSDPRPVAQHLASLQARGLPLAHWGKYHAQFDFSGRLRPVTVIHTPESLDAWLRQNPQGRIMVFVEQASAGTHRPEYERRYRSGYLQVWRASAFYAVHAAPPP